MTAELDTTGDTPRLIGSRDPATGQVYFPQRALAADGSLRPCEALVLSDRGRLVTWTRFAGEFFGQVDLPEGVRVQGRLGDGPQEIGADYVLDVETPAEGPARWRFRRG